MIIKEKTGEKINNPGKVANLIRSVLAMENEVDQEKEHFWVIGLDAQLKLKYLELVSLGSLMASIVEPREVFRMAIMKGVAGIIVSHNHPSGTEDVALTKKLVDGGKILKIPVYDHVIVTEDSWYSFKEEGEFGIYE